MYKLTIKGNRDTFTIPKENITLLAYAKAMDNGYIISPNDKEGAIAYLESVGIKVENA
jgi:hypothetical protein